MNRRVIILVGQGRLANAIKNSLGKYLENCIVDFWENIDQYSNNTHEMVVVHVGSGRQLNEVTRYCSIHGVTLIQGSTGLEYRYGGQHICIDAPNFNILLLKFMHMLRLFGAHYSTSEIEIIESHQQIKKSAPGTAIAIANYLGVLQKDIKSVRDRDIQIKDYKIPVPYVDQHAMHIINITNEDTAISMRVDVNGLESYVSGLATIINNIAGLEKKIYNVVDLIDMKLL